MSLLLECNIKIKTLDELVSMIQVMDADKKIIQCHGVFDLLHIGHIRHLTEAKAMGDILVVTITADAHVNKGPGKPYFNEHLRAEALANLEAVDYVVINQFPTAIEALSIIKPDIYVKGVEYQDASQDITQKIIEEKLAVEQHGGVLAYTDGVVFSSSTLINQFFPVYSDEIREYLTQLKQQHSIDSILNYLNGAKDKDVLLVGEAIIDVYSYCEAMGKSGKEPVLAAKYQYEECYLGGILAIANHLSSFCKSVTCLTYLGEKDEYKDFILENLNDNVTMVPIYKNASPTIVKKRYVDSYLQQKLFEVYTIDDTFLNDAQSAEFSAMLAQQLEQNDLTLIADYGHGLLDDHAIDQLCDSPSFLAVNAQANAANHGLHCISKYKKADFVSMASRELKLVLRQRHLSVPANMQKLMQQQDYARALVTVGIDGVLGCDQDVDIVAAPSLVTEVLDRVGAGDAVFALTSLLAQQNAPMDIICFIANVVGGEAVGVICNKSFIEKKTLMKHIMHLLK